MGSGLVGQRVLVRLIERDQPKLGDIGPGSHRARSLTVVQYINGDNDDDAKGYEQQSPHAVHVVRV